MADHLHGIFPALVTPFDAQGRVDAEAIDALVAFQLNAGVHGLHPGGTTGEAPLLSVEERKLVTERVVRAAHGRVPVIAQVGHIRTDHAVDLARHAHAAGADAISIVSPYYYALPEPALVRYFEAAASAVPDGYPVYLYNIPQLTRNPVTPHVLAEVRTRCPNVRGLKHSEPDLDRLGAYLRTGDQVSVFVGSDGLILAGLSMGAVGAVSGNANVAPELFVALYDAWRQGRHDDARRHQHAIAEIAQPLGMGADLARFKEALRLRGVSVGTVRAPLAPLDEAGRDGAARAVEMLEGTLPEVEPMRGRR